LTLKLSTEGRFAEAEAVNQECLTEIQSQKFRDDWWISGMQSDLGASLLAQGKLAEAEPLLLDGYEGLKRCEYHIPTNAVPRLGEAAGRMARFYEMSGQAEKAAEWRKQQAAAQENAQVAQEAAARRTRGLNNAHQGHMAEAVPDFARVIELHPGDHEIWHWQAVALVWSDQIDLYRELRRKAVAQFERTTDPNIAERIAKDYLILPSAETGLETATKMAEVAVNAATNHSDMAWFRLAKGLAEYRQGHFGATVDSMQQVLSESGSDFKRDAEALLVLAMAQQQLKQTDKARGTLAKAVEIVDMKIGRVGLGQIEDLWVDSFIAQVLMEEAEALIKGNASAATSP
jgi:tetratricopeptide (TPR) repeat protein